MWDWEDPFPAEYDVEAAADYMKSFNSEIEKIKKERKEFFGPNVMELCRQADIVFLGPSRSQRGGRKSTGGL